MPTLSSKAGGGGKRRFSRKIVRERTFVYLFLAYPLLLFAVFYVYVNVDSFVLAFQQVNIDSTREFVGLSNFKHFLSELFSGEGLIRISFINSLIIYAVGICVSLPLQLLFSYMLFKKCFAHKVIRVLIMMPSIISTFVFCLVFSNFAGSALQATMRSLGFENFPNLMDNSKYVFGTTLFYSIWVSFSTSLIIYPNAMRSIDPGIYESAQIDGVCTMWQELRHIILPLIFPTLSTFLVLGFAAMMTDSGALVPFFMYSAPAPAYNMGYYLTVQVFSEPNPMKYPGAAAAGMILTIVIAPLTILLRYFLDRIDPTGDGTNGNKIKNKKIKITNSK